MTSDIFKNIKSHQELWRLQMVQNVFKMLTIQISNIVGINLTVISSLWMINIDSQSKSIRIYLTGSRGKNVKPQCASLKSE